MNDFDYEHAYYNLLHILKTHVFKLNLFNNGMMVNGEWKEYCMKFSSDIDGVFTHIEKGETNG